MNIHCGDFRKEVLKGQKSNMKFTLDQHVGCKNYVFRMGEFISNSVNTLDSWYAFVLHSLLLLFFLLVTKLY